MNTEIWRHIFDAIDDPAFFHDAQFRVLLAYVAYCHEAGVTAMKALDAVLHGQPVQAKNYEAVS